MIKKNEIVIQRKIDITERPNYQLVIDKVYKVGSSLKGAAGDPISNMFGVANMGGFRKKVGKDGKIKKDRFVILYTSGEDLYWHDEIDEEMGVFVYYGDNKIAGSGLHDTAKKGNRFLKKLFERASSKEFDERIDIPPIFIFEKVSGRDVRFRGLAVPGVEGRDEKEWLIAVWANRTEGGRFQNYKALFTILNTEKGSVLSRRDPAINLAWITDVENGQAFESAHAPIAWREYVKTGKMVTLTSEKEKSFRSPEMHLPQTDEGKRMLDYIHEYFVQKDGGYSFEPLACYIAKRMNPSIIDIDLTRKSADGGHDGIGRYKIFESTENSIEVEFFLEAKCYSKNKACGVKETSRLISRIKNRQFGILVTTSYLAQQAYQEIIDDGHPIVIIPGADIIDFFVTHEDINDLQNLKKWIEVKGY